MRHGMIRIAMAMAVVSLLCGCVGETKRMGLDDMADMEIGTGLTSQDFRSCSQRMARSLITLKQVQNATTPPKMAFVSVQNETDNPLIRGNMFLRKMRTHLIKHSDGRIIFLDRATVVAEALDEEQRDMDRGKLTTSGESTPYGADFVLTGVIDSIDKVAGSGRTGYLRLSFRLTECGTRAIVWEDEYEFKKFSKSGIVYD